MTCRMYLTNEALFLQGLPVKMTTYQKLTPLLNKLQIVEPQNNNLFHMMMKRELLEQIKELHHPSIMDLSLSKIGVSQAFQDLLSRVWKNILFFLATASPHS